MFCFYISLNISSPTFLWGNQKALLSPSYCARQACIFTARLAYYVILLLKPPQLSVFHLHNQCKFSPLVLPLKASEGDDDIISPSAHFFAAIQSKIRFHSIYNPHVCHCTLAKVEIAGYISELFIEVFLPVFGWGWYFRKGTYRSVFILAKIWQLFRKKY